MEALIKTTALIGPPNKRVAVVVPLLQHQLILSSFWLNICYLPMGMDISDIVIDKSTNDMHEFTSRLIGR